VRGERDQIGARCPYCRQPLYEAPRDPRRGRDGAWARPDTGWCVEHPKNLAVGTCQRCGNFACLVCWTRWYGKSVCAACVRRALESREVAPERARAHTRQAILSLICGILAWAGTLVALVLIGMGGSAIQDKDPSKAGFVVFIVFGVMLLMVTPLPGLLGVGQGAAAVRARGNHMVLATIGLVMSGLHTGILVGLAVLGTIGAYREFS
jgi:hypothetical protein